MFSRILIANRGEIALRSIRTCKRLNIETVVAYSQADADSLPVRLADAHVCVGPAPARESYLNIRNLVTAGVLSGCDALHPGVGFLAENAGFARDVQEAGLVFVGPDPDVIDLLGDKIRAKKSAKALGIPLVEQSGNSTRIMVTLGSAYGISGDQIPAATPTSGTIPLSSPPKEERT